MSKISRAIYEIQTMDEMAKRDQWVNRIHPLVKLCLTVTYIALVVSFSKYDLTGLGGMVVYPLLLFQMADISFKQALRRLRVVLPVVCIVGIFNPFFDRQVLGYIGLMPITGGVLSMLTLMLKGVLTVLAAYLLIATTGMEEICYALRLLHVPKLFVTQLLLIYRYITVLLAEAGRMAQAYSLRAPGQKGIHYKAWGSFVGQLLLRTMDRAEEIYESMCLRGYQGEFYYCSSRKAAEPSQGYREVIQNGIYLLAWLAVFGIFRMFPVFELVGNMIS
jgi:cobalt/nickel transport system permease protein